jgi:hypothetical protein
MPAARQIAPDEARAELDRRWEEAKARITPEAICSGTHGRRHMVQLAILRCRKQNMIFMCSRRAGKSEVCCGLLLTTAKATADVSCLYLALTKDAAEPIWRKWKKLLKRLDVPHLSSDADQYTEFPNGSRVLFTGTDDLRRVTHLLGDQLAGGIAIIDESQDDPGIMKSTVENVLAPMLDETTLEKPIPGRLVLSGSIPDVAAGYFWETWEANYDEENDRERTFAEKCARMGIEYRDETEDDHWACFAWSRFENPFQTDNEKRERAYCIKYGLKQDDPEVLRRFRGKRIWGKEANAFRFDEKRNTYRPVSVERMDIGPFHCLFAAPDMEWDRFIVGIDQAQRVDRFAIVGLAWNHVRKDSLRQFAEAVTDPGADPLESQWIAVCAEFRTRYTGGSMEFIRDAGGSSAPVNDALKFSHGIVIVSAIKGPGSVKARVQRSADLFALGIQQAIEGSEYASDLKKAAWDKKERARGHWALDKTKQSPDVAESGSYALDLPSYTQIGGMKPPKPRETFEERCAREQKETLEMVMRGKVPKPPPIPNYVKMWLPPPK